MKKFVILGMIILSLLFVQMASSLTDSRPTYSTTTTTLGLVIYQVDKEAERALIAQAEEYGRQLGIDIYSLDINQTVFVIGDNLDGPEKAALAYAQTQAPNILAQSIPASRLTFKEVDNSTILFIKANRPLERTASEGVDNTTGVVKQLGAINPSERLIVLVGGPSQNRITKAFEEAGRIGNTSIELMNQMIALSGVTSDGARILVISDKRGFGNLERKAAEYSPLAACMPLQWVPIVASIIGAVFVSLVNIVKAYVEMVIASIGKKKYTINKNARKVGGLKIREVLAVIGASFVLGAAISWTFAGPTVDFIWLLLLNTSICLVGGMSHEVIHWLMSRLLKIETEYRFWWSGSITTLITAFLGNSFGLQGFLVEEVDENTPRWKTGLMKLSSPVFSTGITIIFAGLNFFLPNVVFQMVFSIASVLAMVEVLPFQPMDGYDIRKWNILIWLTAFAITGLTFVTVNFII